MTPHKQAGGRSYRIDRVFAGVGRIALSSGTTHAGTFGRISAMLTGLATIGRVDLLAAIRDREHTPLVVLHYYERSQLEKLPSKETSAPLLTALWAFQARHECGKSYRADLGTSIRHIAEVASKATTVGDLSKMVRACKERMAGTPIAFNRLRTHMMAFASDVQGKQSPLWVDVVRVNRFKKTEGTRAKTLQRRPLTVRELDQVCAAFEDHVYRRGNAKQPSVIRGVWLADMARTLAYTGMRPAEYWERGGATWALRTHLVKVHGTKTAAAQRIVPRVGLIAHPHCGEQFFRRAFATATAKTLRVSLDAYSLRRTFAKLCEDAGIVASRRAAYLGHGPKTVTDLYLQTNVLPFAEQDAVLLTAWIVQERRPAHIPINGPIALVRGS